MEPLNGVRAGVASLGAEIKNGGTKRIRRIERMLEQRHTAAHGYSALLLHLRLIGAE